MSNFVIVEFLLFTEVKCISSVYTPILVSSHVAAGCREEIFDDFRYVKMLYLVESVF